MQNQIFLLVDYRGNFYSSVKRNGEGFRMDILQESFASHGYQTKILHYPEIDFRKQNYKGQYVLYHSSEDIHLFYKSYLEDILLGMHLQGAHLIPNFFQFRAHHNKVFMEIMRDLSPLEEIKGIVSRGYGTYEDFERDLHLYPTTLVMKPSEGALSEDVRLLKTDEEKKKHALKISSSPERLRTLKNFINHFRRESYAPKSVHRKKFIVQNFIPELHHDYKILIYFDKYYVLERKVRKNDFRASGSGIFSYQKSLPSGLLDYAKAIFDSFGVPYLSLDVASVQGQFFLFEFQFMSFGNYTIENSNFHFVKKPEGWQIVEENPQLERIFADSVVKYIAHLASKTL